MVYVYTIGTSGKKQDTFLKLIKANGIKRIIDIRLNNYWHMLGYSQKEKLSKLLKCKLACEYIHLKELAPTRILLSSYKKKNITWTGYAKNYMDLMKERNTRQSVKQAIFTDRKTCLLCSCIDEKICHRRLVAQMLSRSWSNTEVRHILADGNISSWKPGDKNYFNDDIVKKIWCPKCSHASLDHSSNGTFSCPNTHGYYELHKVIGPLPYAMTISLYSKSYGKVFKKWELKQENVGSFFIDRGISSKDIT